MSVATIGQNTSNTFAGFEDTTLRDNAGAFTTNYSTDPDLYVSKYAAGDYRAALVKVTGLTSLPAGQTISAATIYLKLSGGAIDPITISWRRILRHANFALATGEKYDATNNWTSLMGVGNGTDRSNTISAAIAVDLVNAYKGFTSAQLLADIQDMYANPGTNEGWNLERTGGADDTGYRLFISSEGADGSRPYVDLTYAAAGGGAARTSRLTLLGVS